VVEALHEDLATTGIQGRDDGPGGLRPKRGRQHLERVDRKHRSAERQRQAPRRGDPGAHAGEAAGTVVHRDHVERVVVESRVPQRFIDQFDQPVRLIGRPFATTKAERVAGSVAQRDRTHRSGAVQGEQDHGRGTAGEA
jgi:hypothetical protein